MSIVEPLRSETLNEPETNLMDTLIYIIYGILVLCAIVVFIRLGKPGSFIPHPYEDDEMFDSRTVAQMRGDWDEDK